MSDAKPSKEQMLEEADARIGILEQMGYFEEAVRKWRLNRIPCVNERTTMAGNGTHFGTVFTEADNIEDHKWIYENIRKFEKDNNGLVYAASTEEFEFGTVADLFYVSNYPEEWKRDRKELEEGFPCVYCANKKDVWCNEYGSIGFVISGGGILRTN